MFIRRARDYSSFSSQVILVYLVIIIGLLSLFCRYWLVCREMVADRHRRALVMSFLEMSRSMTLNDFESPK